MSPLRPISNVARRLCLIKIALRAGRAKRWTGAGGYTYMYLYVKCADLY